MITNQTVATAPKVRMYCTVDCPYCGMAERLLRAKGVQNIDKLHVDFDPALREEMTQLTQRRTVPQVFIGDSYVGGYIDLAALDRDGRLRELLEGRQS